ncbi:glycosyltransferase involved in cell wall biosynthesis [Flavobacterium chryseum]|uniref:glycosyltransferase n=1 Tax=Flavobacterium sp. P3160 TaxID=2512113 RepID=UPI001060FAFA|nr:glycosyltransferase [Flavobacterium sp. P3160]TDO77441.1 glycosyltransferase involved in cell wall biosynthesis [Flavobacterium sp. P3160]
MKKNILFITHDTLLYGANQSLINMVSSLKDKGVMTKVIFPDKGPICKHFDDLAIEYSIVRYKSESIDPRKNVKSKFLNFLRLLNKAVTNGIAIKKLQKIVKVHNITIVHSNSSVVGIGQKLAKKENIRHVWHLREYIDLDHGMDIFGGIEKLKNRIKKSDKVICISESILQHFGVQNNAIVLYNSVRKIANSFQSKRKRDYFLFCGSLVKNKGVEEAINAFYNVFQHNNTIRLCIAGGGEFEYEEYLKNLVSQLKIEANVEFLGFRKDVDVLMSNALGLLMCSKNEALGRVTIEAMLNSCLVIGFNNAGTAELIKNNLTGFLYIETQELSDYMLKIVNDSADNFEQIRLNAYNYACANFLEKHYGINLINYYNSFSL